MTGLRHSARTHQLIIRSFVISLFGIKLWQASNKEALRLSQDNLQPITASATTNTTQEMLNVKANTRWGTRRTTAWLLGLGLVLHTCVGVRCFAYNEVRHRALQQSRLVSNAKISPRHHCMHQIQQHRCGAQYATQLVGDSEPEHAGQTSMNGPTEKETPLGIWPCMDEMDRKLIKISLPVIANFAINPLIGAVDLFWVNRMGNALAVAGQAAANQVFNSAFWFVSFLPSVTATLVSKKHAAGDKDGTQDAVCQALVVGFFISLIGTSLMFLKPEKALSSVLKAGAPAVAYARPYLMIRSFSFLPSIISLVGFSAFRGILDTKTPVKISAFANIFNALLDPILIFSFALGVPGAALATLAAEIISATLYLFILRKRKLIRWSKIVKLPKWATLEPLLRGGLALQLRNLSLNVTFLMVARVTQAIDKSGVAAAAHAMAIQTFQIGGIVLLALSTVAQTVVPNAMVERYDEENSKVIGGLEYAKSTVNRLMSWGFVLGILLGSLQVALLPAIRKATPLQEVRDAATVPALIASVLQIINGLVFIGEGVMVGTGSFLQLSLSTVVATTGCLMALWYFPPKIGLTGVWLGFGVFNMIRLAGVWIHQTKNGPLSRRRINLETASSGT